MSASYFKKFAGIWSVSAALFGFNQENHLTLPSDTLNSCSSFFCCSKYQRIIVFSGIAFKFIGCDR